MEKENSVTLRGNADTLYIWPIWVIAITFGLLNMVFPQDIPLRTSSGVIFIIASLPSLATSMIRLRGIWSLVTLLLLLIFILFSKITLDAIDSDFSSYIYSLIPEIMNKIAIKITHEIYFMIGIPLMTISFMAYLFEYRKCVIVTTKEIIVQGTYKGRQTYDSKHADFKERRRDWFKYFFGFYAGDLEIYISHGTQTERIEIKNMTDIDKKMAIIHHLKGAR